MAVQEIIVYRNPGEKALWDFSAAYPELIFAAIIGFFVFVIVGSLFNHFIGWRIAYRNREKYQVLFSLIMALLSAYIFLQI